MKLLSPREREFGDAGVTMEGGKINGGCHCSDTPHREPRFGGYLDCPVYIDRALGGAGRTSASAIMRIRFLLHARFLAGALAS